MGHSAQGLWFNPVDTLACYLPSGHIMEHVDREGRLRFSKQRMLWPSSRQPPQPPQTLCPEGTQDREKQDSGLHSYAAYHTRGVIPMSPNSCILPYMEKHYNC